MLTASENASGYDESIAGGNVLPTISIIIPTLNSERTLEECLRAIREQAYPQESLEIIVADGGSTDATLEIARRYDAYVVANPLITGEAGKAAGVHVACNDLIALIDSDNIIVGKDWLKKMVAPFEDVRVIGAEPIRFEACVGDGYIDRYCALAGVNDPLCLFIGNYDRQSVITGKWTDLPVHVVDINGEYTLIRITGDQPVPTIGANGTIYRRSAIASLVGEYLMDIDLPIQIACASKGILFAKVNCGIRHLYCRDFSAFVRKQERRIRDFMSKKHQDGERVYPWKNLIPAGIARFSIACILVVPLFVQALVGYRRSRDVAIWFHPLACLTTLWVYAVNVVFFRGRETDRSSWRQ